MSDAAGDAERKSKSEGSGSGLGMFIAKTLLERSGAKLAMGNGTPDRGAAVTVTWPRAMFERSVAPRVSPRRLDGQALRSLQGL